MDFFLLFMSILWGCTLSFPYILLAHTINSSKKQKETEGTVRLDGAFFFIP